MENTVHCLAPFTKVCFGQFLELWPADTVVVGMLLNTAGPGLLSTSFTSPYKQQDIDETEVIISSPEFVSMLSSKTHLAKTW